MKKNFICLCIFFSYDSLFAQTTISHNDPCIDKSEEALDTIINFIPLYKIHDSLFQFLAANIGDCLTLHNSNYSSYDLEYRRESDQYILHIQKTFNIEKTAFYEGIFFIGNTPIFLFSEKYLSPKLFIKTEEIIQVKRITQKGISFICQDYKTKMQNLLTKINNQYIDILHITCIE